MQLEHGLCTILGAMELKFDAGSKAVEAMLFVAPPSRCTGGKGVNGCCGTGGGGPLKPVRPLGGRLGLFTTGSVVAAPPSGIGPVLD